MNGSMNDIMPENVYYQTANENIPYAPSEITIGPNSTQNYMNNKYNYNTNSFRNNLKHFFLTNSLTILGTAIAMSIGFAFKDFVFDLINNLIQPLLIKLILLVDVNNAFNLSGYLTSQNVALNFTKLVSSFITFIMVVLIVYYSNLYFFKIV